MVVDWERLAMISGKVFLLFLEYCIKLSAVVVTAVVMAAQGTLGVKLSTGFTSISKSLRVMFEAPSGIKSAYQLIYEYNTLPAGVFVEQNGTESVAGLMAYLNGAVIYFQSVFYNFAYQPYATFFAALIAFFTLYITSRVVRFYRQKGEGSFFTRMERKLGEYIFKTPKELLKPELRRKAEPANEESSASEEPGRNRNIRKFGTGGSNNKFLEDYIRHAQNGDG
jgi:hypothetical protein